jgi:hypothetical protein
MKNNVLFLLVILSVLGGCKKDNREPPKSTLTGTVLVEGTKQPVGVASNRVQLELWQNGYALFQKIPVYVDQDGTFSANLFDGQYKLVRLSGAPWMNNTDTVIVNLKGSSTVDVPVKPFFTVANDNITFSAADTSISASFNVSRMDATKTADRVSLHLGLTTFVDAVSNQIPLPAANNDKAPASDYLTAASTFKLFLNPARYSGTANAELRRQLTMALQSGYLFARVAVRTTGVTERFYSQVKQINLK